MNSSLRQFTIYSILQQEMNHSLLSDIAKSGLFGYNLKENLSIIREVLR